MSPVALAIADLRRASDTPYGGIEFGPRSSEFWDHDLGTAVDVLEQISAQVHRFFGVVPQIAIMEEPASESAASSFFVGVPTARLTVAPGIAMSANEYRQRFEGLDLAHLKQRMSPELFKAFVRFCGAIPGDPDLDIVEAARIPR